MPTTTALMETLTIARTSIATTATTPTTTTATTVTTSTEVEPMFISKPLLQHQFGDSDQKFLIKYPQLIFILTEPKAEHATDIFPADKNLAELLAPNGTKTYLGPISLRSKLQQLDTSAALSLKMPLLRFKEKVLTSIVD